MPNHIHFMVKTDRIEVPLAKFHSFTGHEIIKLLKKHDDKELLEFFAASAKTKKRDRERLVWQDSVVRIIETEEVLLDLIEYTHNNPVSKKWRLADSRSDYPYSSACYYDNGIQPTLPIDDLGELLAG